jgi:hypothetical protein
MNRHARSFLAAAILGAAISVAQASPRIVVTLPPGHSAEGLSGRLLLVLSPKPDGEPREHVSWDGDAVPFFGMDVENWQPGHKKVFDSKVDGFPVRSLADLPPGEYRIQAVLNRYEKFMRSDGRTLLLPPDRGEGQVWRSKPGNLYSKPLSLRLDGERSGRAEVVLDQVITPGRGLRGQADEIRPALQPAQRTALEVLGTRHRVVRLGAAALGLR